MRCSILDRFPHFSPNILDVKSGPSSDIKAVTLTIIIDRWKCVGHWDFCTLEIGTKSIRSYSFTLEQPPTVIPHLGSISCHGARDTALKSLKEDEATLYLVVGFQSS